MQITRFTDFSAIFVMQLTHFTLYSWLFQRKSEMATVSPDTPISCTATDSHQSHFWSITHNKALLKLLSKSYCTTGSHVHTKLWSIPSCTWMEKFISQIIWTRNLCITMKCIATCTNIIFNQVCSTLNHAGVYLIFWNCFGSHVGMCVCICSSVCLSNP